MENIKVDKGKLLETLHRNRDEHRSLFLKAQVKYREAVIAELDKRLQQARDGGVIHLIFNLPEPVDYTSEYDTAIRMLEWDVSNIVELDESSFERFVLNKWHWARSFAAGTMSYVGR